MAARRKLIGRCSECGQSTEIAKGHVGNWPRQLARRYESLDVAVRALIDNIDDSNEGFAVPEFIDERVKMAIEARDAKRATHD